MNVTKEENLSPISDNESKSNSTIKSIKLIENFTDDIKKSKNTIK